MAKPFSPAKKKQSLSQPSLGEDESPPFNVAHFIGETEDRFRLYDPKNMSCGQGRYRRFRPELSICFAVGGFDAAKRLAVRFSEDALAAFIARAVRSFCVMFFAAVLPPSAPVLRAISDIAARISGGIFTLMPSMIQLTGYAERDTKIASRFRLTA